MTLIALAFSIDASPKNSVRYLIAREVLLAKANSPYKYTQLQTIYTVLQHMF